MNKASGGDGIPVEQNIGLDEAEAGIKIARRNTNNLRYADDTTLRAESEEELKSHQMKVKEESEKVGLKLNIPAIWNTQQWPEDWKRSVFIATPKKYNAKECSDYHTIALISLTNK